MQRSESVFNFIMRAYKSRFIKGYILSYKSKIMCNFQIEFYWTKDAELIPVKEASLVPYRQFLVTLVGLAPVLLQHLTGGKQWTSTERRFDLSTWSLYNAYMSINLAQVKAKRLIWSFVNNSMRKAETQTGGSPRDHTCLHHKKFHLDCFDIHLSL